VVAPGGELGFRREAVAELRSSRTNRSSPPGSSRFAP